jgi:hemolysin D
MVLSVSEDAVVKDKDTDGINPQKPNDPGDKSDDPQQQSLFYEARVSLDRTRMQIEDKLVNLGPGMAVTVEIKTGSRRVIEYVLSPLLRYRHDSLTER